MGGSLAVELAQASHFGLLQKEVGACRASELVVYRPPFPRGPFWEILAIDDHVGIQAVSPTPPSLRGATGMSSRRLMKSTRRSACASTPRRRSAKPTTKLWWEMRSRGASAPSQLRVCLLPCSSLSPWSRSVSGRALLACSPAWSAVGSKCFFIGAASPERLH